MLRYKVTFDNSEFVRIDKKAADLPVRFRANMLKRAPTIRTKMLSIVVVVPGPPRYPIRWVNRDGKHRQRKAFFASNGFGRGIPTGRVNEPGGVLGAYDVSITAEGFAGKMFMVNDYPGAQFIIGDDQQPFHDDTGWERIDEAGQRAAPMFADETISVWNDTVLE